jgi:hypothetical protein
MQYSLHKHEDGRANLTVFHNGEMYPANSDHPNFDQIVEGLVKNDESIIGLFDVAQTAADKFERLTERVTTANGRLYLDGVEIHNTLSEQVVRVLKEGGDVKPLLHFFENVLANENEHSREQLYTWLKDRPFTITPDGLIVGYKGVQSDGNGGFQSLYSGKAIVDGKVHIGQIPNYKGALVEMPRDEVNHDPSQGCHTGLHVGTYDFAKSYSYNGALLEVHVNPRDVVSVPTDSNAAKMRVCRYLVVNTIDAPHTTAVTPRNEEEDPFNDNWGDNEGDDLFEEEEIEEEDEHEEETEATWDDLIDQTFETTDPRRQGTKFKVESIERDPEFASRYVAVGKSLPRNLTRKVSVDRLLSRKYRKV